MAAHEKSSKWKTLESPDVVLLDDCHDHSAHHLAPPLDIVASDNHKPLRPLLFKLWIASQVLQLGTEATFTALVLLHRYYYNYYCNTTSPSEDDDSHDWKWIGASCLVLGMKAEEEVRRLRDVINVAQMLDFGLVDDNANTSGINDDIMIDISTTPPALNQEYWKAKEWIVATEQHVLRVLQFDVLVSHPHRLVVLVVNDLNLEDVVVGRAWQRLNHALFHAPSLMANALTLACAAVELEVHRGPNTYSTVGDARIGDVDACMKQLLKAATTTMKKNMDMLIRPA